MQEDSLNEDEKTAGDHEHGTGVARHRAPRPRRRIPYIVAAGLAAAGLAVVGATVAVARQGDPPTPTTVSIDAQSRAEEAERANRSAREPITFSAGPTESADATEPTTSPSASPSPSRSAAATPKATKSAAPKATKSATAKPAPSWVHPMPGAAVTSCYGQRWGVLHAGVDLALPADTPIRAVAAGTIVNSGWDFDGYGISVVVDHGNGYLTHYAHMSRTSVAVGAKVSAGQTIGYEGSTGDSTGPHLHFEVHQGQLWSQIDPTPFMRTRGVNLGC